LFAASSSSIEDLTRDLKQLEANALSELQKADSLQEVEKIRVAYLGKKSPIQAAMGKMRDLTNEDKPKLGKVVNEIKAVLEDAVAEAKEKETEKKWQQLIEETAVIDPLLPGVPLPLPVLLGHRHPLQMTMEKAVGIFVELGFDVVDGPMDSPEIENDFYCFEALNCPPDHPARDMQDTFYLTEDQQLMLRTHTSAVQIRYMERHEPPFRIVAPGRVYRKDDVDATHSPVFHQVEILAIEEKGELTLCHLKGTVEYFLKRMLGSEIKVKFRGSYFPFTEPSMEVDVFFKGKWLEVLGCGMVDPRVLRNVGIDPEKYSGFAAGFGVERFAMVIHDIPDIRLFYENDFRFLTQFPSDVPSTSLDEGDDEFYG